MKIKTEHALRLRDGNLPEKRAYVEIDFGEHEVEIVPSPARIGDSPWLVLKGTKIGLPQGRLYCDPAVTVIYDE